MTSGAISATDGMFPTSRDELIVAMPYEGEVRRALDELKIASSLVESCAPLGLAKLLLTRSRGDAKDSDPATTAAAQAHEYLDDVIGQLRDAFGERYGGWYPPIGKNRIIGQVLGVGEVTFGGSGNPRPAAPQWQPRGVRPGQGVTVGVLDTGITDASWLSGAWLAESADIFVPGEDPAPAHAGHATFVAGLVLNEAPGATIKVSQALDDTGEAHVWEVAKRIVEFGSSGIDILNLSFACYTKDGQPPMALATAIDRLDPDIVVVAAAGNHGHLEFKPTNDRPGRSSPAWPAALDDVVAVGAADKNRNMASFSPQGPWVDLLANGVDVTSTYFDGRVELPSTVPGASPSVAEFHGMASWSGTSFAAARVSGAIAAKTQPGRVSARAAYEEIRSDLYRDPPSPPNRPPFLDLD